MFYSNVSQHQHNMRMMMMVTTMMPFMTLMMIMEIMVMNDGVDGDIFSLNAMC